jgi:undecaprenyl-diphosphatase
MFEAIIIGLVEGLTEFLPVSSTGHMLIVEHIMGSKQSDAFNVLIQVGPIIAVALVFWRDILNFLTKWKDPAQRDYVYKLAAAFALTGVGGFIAKKIGLKLPEEILPVAMALVMGAFVIFVVESRAKRMQLNSSITWGIVVAVAAGQLLAAIFPGASRSGMAIMGALMLGLARPEAVKFSFLVGIPTMLAAGGYQLLSAVKAGETQDLLTPEALVAYTVATVTAWLTVVWLLKFVQTRNFIPFAWYRIALGLALFAIF